MNIGNFAARSVALAILCTVVFGCQTTKLADLSAGQTGSVAYEGYSGETLTANLRLPEAASGKVPAVILVHGSGGIGYREATWGAFFRKHGYATMVIDMFGPRGFTPMSGKNVGGYDDVIDAFNMLRTHPRIDPDRVAVMGWSWGAGITLSSAVMTEGRGKGHTFKAHVSMYPVCGVNAVPYAGPKDAKILVVIGTKDTYTKDWQCKEIVDKGVRDGRDVKLIVYDGAFHGFDGNKSATFTHLAFGRQTIKPDARITEQARKDVLAFIHGAM